MKRISLFLLVFCLLLAGCGAAQKADTPPATEKTPETTVLATQDTTAVTGEAETGRTIAPLPDTTMDTMTDTILSVSLEEGKAYVDDTGKMQMDLTVYSYDRYDMVDISLLQVGDTILRNSGEVAVTSLERDETGRIFINGGLDNGGFDLVTDEGGLFFEMGYNDHKNWYEVGYATIRVSVDFIFTDNSDLDQRDAIYYPGDFLVDGVIRYDFTPYNTTVRVEDGQIVEMNRRYIP